MDQPRDSPVIFNDQPDNGNERIWLFEEAPDGTPADSDHFYLDYMVKHKVSPLELIRRKGDYFPDERYEDWYDRGDNDPYNATGYKECLDHKVSATATAVNFLRALISLDVHPEHKERMERMISLLTEDVTPRDLNLAAIGESGVHVRNTRARYILQPEHLADYMPVVVVRAGGKFHHLYPIIVPGNEVNYLNIIMDNIAIPLQTVAKTLSSLARMRVNERMGGNIGALFFDYLKRADPNANASVDVVAQDQISLLTNGSDTLFPIDMTNQPALTDTQQPKGQGQPGNIGGRADLSEFGNPDEEAEDMSFMPLNRDLEQLAVQFADSRRNWLRLSDRNIVPFAFHRNIMQIHPRWMVALADVDPAQMSDDIAAEYLPVRNHFVSVIMDGERFPDISEKMEIFSMPEYLDGLASFLVCPAAALASNQEAVGWMMMGVDEGNKFFDSVLAILEKEDVLFTASPGSIVRSRKDIQDGVVNSIANRGMSQEIVRPSRRYPEVLQDWLETTDSVEGIYLIFPPARGSSGIQGLDYAAKISLPTAGLLTVALKGAGVEVAKKLKEGLQRTPIGDDKQLMDEIFRTVLPAEIVTPSPQRPSAARVEYDSGISDPGRGYLHGPDHSGAYDRPVGDYGMDDNLYDELNNLLSLGENIGEVEDDLVALEADIQGEMPFRRRIAATRLRVKDERVKKIISRVLGLMRNLQKMRYEIHIMLEDKMPGPELRAALDLARTIIAHHQILFTRETVHERILKANSAAYREDDDVYFHDGNKRLLVGFVSLYSLLVSQLTMYLTAYRRRSPSVSSAYQSLCRSAANYKEKLKNWDVYQSAVIDMAAKEQEIRTQIVNTLPPMTPEEREAIFSDTADVPDVVHRVYEDYLLSNVETPSEKLVSFALWLSGGLVGSGKRSTEKTVAALSRGRTTKLRNWGLAAEVWWSYKQKSPMQRMPNRIEPEPDRSFQTFLQGCTQYFGLAKMQDTNDSVLGFTAQNVDIACSKVMPDITAYMDRMMQIAEFCRNSRDGYLQDVEQRFTSNVAPAPVKFIEELIANKTMFTIVASHYPDEAKAAADAIDAQRYVSVKTPDIYNTGSVMSVRNFPHLAMLAVQYMKLRNAARGYIVTRALMQAFDKQELDDWIVVLSSVAGQNKPDYEKIASLMSETLKTNDGKVFREEYLAETDVTKKVELALSVVPEPRSDELTNKANSLRDQAEKNRAMRERRRLEREQIARAAATAETYDGYM